MSDERAVLDSSAVLALLFDEAGGESVIDRLSSAVISAVNLSEVIAKQHDRGLSDAVIAANLADLKLATIPFDEAIALRAGALRGATRSKGLSLGDRACLATAQELDLPVLTADQAWAGLKLGIAVELVR